MKLQDIIALPDLAVAKGFSGSVSRVLAARSPGLADMRNDTFDFQSPAAEALAARLATVTKMQAPNGKMCVDLVLIDDQPVALRKHVQRRSVGQSNGATYALHPQAIDWLVAEVKKLRRPEQPHEMPTITKDADLDAALFAELGPDHVFDAQAPGHIGCKASTGFAALEFRDQNRVRVTGLLLAYEDGSLAMQTTLLAPNGVEDTSFTRFDDPEAAQRAFARSATAALDQAERAVCVRTMDGEFDLVYVGLDEWTMTNASGEAVNVDRAAALERLCGATDSMLAPLRVAGPGRPR